MQAKPTRVPLGGSFWLFMAGLVLEIAVSAVAARATVVEILREQGVDVDIPMPAPVDRPTPVETVPASHASVDEALSAQVATLRERCYDRGHAEGLLPAATWPLRITVDADGAVVGVQVDGPGMEMRECIEREARTWRFPAPGTSRELFHAVSFVSEQP